MREIDEAKLEPGEVERLNERRGYLDNVERIATALNGAREALAGDDGGATASLGAASAALSAVAKFAGDLREMAERAATLQGEAGDLSADVARALGNGRVRSVRTRSGQRPARAVGTSAA